MPASTRPVDADPSGAPIDGVPRPFGQQGTAALSRSSWSASWALSAWGVASPALVHTTLPPADAAHQTTVDGVLRLALHDLRNSLSAIQLGLELLGRREGLPPPSQQPPSAVLAHMDNAAQRAQASVVELEDLTRLAAGRRLAVSPAHFSLHTVVRDTLDACRLIVPGVVVEHDRLGDGDCRGDPARMAQFLGLALEELCTAATPARVIVISEVAGDRFRMAVHAEGAVGAAPAADDPAAAPARAQARRRVLLQAIAQAHGGDVGFEGGYASGGRSVEGNFSRLADPSSPPEQGLP